MKKSILNPTHPVAAITIFVVGIFAVASVNLQANELQVGRYSLLAATPTEAQTELLATTMTVRFPERIQTVGESIRYLLQRSGYRLATAESIGPDAVALFALPCLYIGLSHQLSCLVTADRISQCIQSFLHPTTAVAIP